jgi:two-component system NtrC family sensor kinase
MNDSRLEIIGSAAAGIAHDVNNQLNLIVNHLAVADVPAAQRAAQRCAVLTSSLLAYCRREPVVLDAIEPTDFLRAFATDLRLPDGVDLQLVAPEASPAISADTLALTRILTNLLLNACDAIKNQGTIRIVCAPLAIEVADYGPGIPAENLERIFDPFFTTKGANGTGLGLAIVRDLMRRQRGSVSVRSEPGQGARFKLSFRAA